MKTLGYIVQNHDNSSFITDHYGHVILFSSKEEADSHCGGMLSVSIMPVIKVHKERKERWARVATAS